MGCTLYGLSTGWEPRESLIHEKTTPVNFRSKRGSAGIAAASGATGRAPFVVVNLGAGRAVKKYIYKKKCLWSTFLPLSILVVSHFQFHSYMLAFHRQVGLVNTCLC